MRTWIPVFALTTILALPLPACGGSTVYTLIGTSRSVGTDGQVEVEETDGGNFMVTVDLENLPPPERLGSGLTTYVVWFVREGASPSLAGVLNFDPEERTGRMMATTPYSEFRVRVTAERSRAATSPSSIVVAEQRVEE